MPRARIAVLDGYNGGAQPALHGFEGSPGSGQNDAPLLSGSGAPPIAVPWSYRPQSYFDSTLLEKAILSQPVGNPIVPSTEPVGPNGATGYGKQIPGYSYGLHPSSGAPLAVQPILGDGKSGPVTVLKPGQWVKPQGFGGKPFSGLRYGCPFGWLGGGVGQLVVFQAPDAEVRWPTDSEIVFHRLRLSIASVSAALGTTASPNWPLRFPWKNAVSGANSISQAGNPSLSVKPTRTELRLRVAAGAVLAAVGSLRLYLFQSDDLDMASDATFPAITAANGASFVDLDFGTWTASGATISAVQVVEFPLVSISEPLLRLGGDQAWLVPVALTSNLNSGYLDVIRYGTL